MHTKVFKTLSIFLLICSFVLLGCDDRTNPGEVARINGRIITIRQLEAMYNSSLFEPLYTQPLEHENFYKKYGIPLTDLLILELVKQQLEKKTIAITDEESLAEENKIRADYPKGVFEEILVSEGMDLDTWRFLYRNHLSLNKFLNEILKPQISVPAEEATEYYKNHPELFMKPPGVHFIYISGMDRNVIKEAKIQLTATGDAIRLEKDFPTIIVRTVTADINRIPPVYSKAFLGLKPGQFTSILKDEETGSFMAFLLLEHTSERIVSPDEAYPVIEKTLIEEKLQTAFQEWASGRLKKSNIKIVNHLMPDKNREVKLHRDGEITIPSAKEEGQKQNDAQNRSSNAKLETDTN